jgi:hypothetical protein
VKTATLIRAAAAALLTAAALAAATPAGAVAAPSETSVRLHDAVEHLRVAQEDRTGYDRQTSYGGWIDADHDGCNTRNEVLLEEAVTPPSISGKCKLMGGSWHSEYDGLTFTNASDLDIDHRVPLAENWDSGGSRWSKAKRVRYANYLTDPRHLLAVSARTNRQKADGDPADWLPPLESVRCQYVADWMSVKLTWDLSIDPAERDALTRIADGCPDEPIDYTPVED